MREKTYKEMTEPNAIDAEFALLGAILEDKTLLTDVQVYANTKTLYDEKSVLLFNIINKMERNNEHVDMITVCCALSDDDKEQGVNEYFITGLTNSNLTRETAIVYAKKIYEKYLVRTVLEKTKDIQQEAHGNKDVFSSLNTAHNLISEMISIRPGGEFNISDEIMNAISSIKNSKENLIKTGFKSIDDLCGGMTRGEISIIGGRPGHGKTTMILNVLKNCVDAGNKVLMINREMTNVEMLKKLITLESENLSYMMIRQGIFENGDVEEIERTKKVIEEKYNKDRFLMFDKIYNFSNGASEIKKFKPDVIIDDYIQLISPENGIDQRRLQLEKIVNDYKWLAKNNNCVVILVSQLNRMLEHRGDAKPRLSDLAESGSIEQVAENVIFVYYDYKIHTTDSRLGPNVIEAICSKVRYGNSGTARLGFNGDKAKLYQSIEDFRNAKK